MSATWEFALCMISIIAWVSVATRLLLWRIEKFDDEEDETDERN
jgi:hypothetical protein